ncbi:MAG: hypothetical protein KGH71_01155, partial [Candidatus Micrarchaeota archaeon]|nr:hypothetical protein [Candidatus Micrarchaeota archaeon]
GWERAKSIHLESWPKPHGKKEKEIEDSQLLVRVILFIRKWKHDNRLALNSEVGEVTISKETEKRLSRCVEELKSAMKIKEVKFGTGEMYVEEGVRLSIKA